MKLEINLKHANEIPVFTGEHQTECLLLNKCDGWHTAFINFDYDDNEFISFSDFVNECIYEPNVFFVAWAELPDVNQLVERLVA